MSTVTGADLGQVLAQVTSPPEGGFSVRDVPDAAGYKIGRGTDGIVALLTPPDSSPEPPTRLRTLSLDPRLLCSLDGGGNSEPTQAHHGVVQVHHADDEVLGPFLAVAASVIRLLGSSPAPGEVSKALRLLVRLFDRTEPPRESVVGLFGELLVIHRSSDPGAMVDSWHAHVDARFDFSAEGSRLEVKTTTSAARVHEFNLKQLKPVTGAVARIASIMTTETSAGTSISELMSKVEQAVATDARRQMKVHEQVAATLGGDWTRHVGRKFDEQQARESLVILDPANVPQVEEGPAEVLSIHLKVDCTDVPADTAPPGLAALVRSPTSEG